MKLELEARIESILNGLTAKLDKVLQYPVHLTGTKTLIRWVECERSELHKLSEAIEGMSTEQLGVMAVFIELESRVFCGIKFEILNRLQSQFCYFRSFDGHRINKSFRKLTAMFDPMAESRPQTRYVLKEIKALQKHLRRGLVRMQRPRNSEPLAVPFSDDDWPDESTLRGVGFPTN